MFNGKTFLAELIGTFGLVFVAATIGGITGGLSGGLGFLLLEAPAVGLVLAVLVYSYGSISGAHFNPAVTFGMALNGTIKWGQAAFYWIAQFVGAILAGFLMSYLVQALGNPLDGAATTGMLTAESATTQTYIMAMVMEAVLTFFLVNTILHTFVAGKAGAMAGWAIGAAYTFAIMAGGVFTGGSLNPARTLGVTLPLAVSSKDFSAFASPFYYVVYFFGPLIGATLAVLAYNYFQGITEDDAEEAEVVDAVETEQAAN